MKPDKLLSFLLTSSLVTSGVLALLMVWSKFSNDEDDDEEEVTEEDGVEYTEGFKNSPSYPETHHKLLLDSIYGREMNPILKTHQDQSKKVAKTEMSNYSQKSNNDKEFVTPCGGKAGDPNMCLYGQKKQLKHKTSIEAICRPENRPDRVGWFISKKT
tara:strand:- start:4815 stop:5288 length:474 start_codon:yes stop_codon:yes gene_type:complete